MRASLLFLPASKGTRTTHRSNATKALMEGGYIRELGDGLFAYLPLGMIVLRNIVQLIQQELKKLGGQEILMPILNPMELWEATGRDKLKASELLVLRDNAHRELVVAPTHEEAMLELIRNVVHASWQLPAFFYQVQAKGRDVANNRQGILMAREYLMNDGYSIHRSFTELNNFIPRIHHAYRRIFNICGLKPLVSEGAAFFLEGERSFDFLVTHKSGDYRVVTCETCGYISDQELAVGLSKISYSKPLKLDKAAKKGLGDLKDLAQVLGLPLSRIALARVYARVNGLVMVLYRADQHLSLEKAGRLLGDSLLHPVADDELAQLGLCVGFASPLGQDLEGLADRGITVVADNLVAETPNLIIGGNAPGCYWVNSNFGRDYEAHRVGDICRVDEHNRCYHCGGALQVRPAIKLASILRINDSYTRRMNIKVKDSRGQDLYPFMGSCSISLDRLVAAVALVYQDHRGLRWPMELAPYKAVLHVVGKAARLHAMAEEIHRQLSEHILWDDRPLSFVRKCLDADRMGIPMRIIVSAASLGDRQVEILSRTGHPHRRVALNQIKGVMVEYWRSERKFSGMGEDS